MWLFLRYKQISMLRLLTCNGLSKPTRFCWQPCFWLADRLVISMAAGEYTRPELSFLRQLQRGAASLPV